MYVRGIGARRAAKEIVIYCSFAVVVICLFAGVNSLVVGMDMDLYESGPVEGRFEQGPHIPVTGVQIDGHVVRCDHAVRFRIPDLFFRTVASGTKYYRNGSLFDGGEMGVLTVQEYPKRQYFLKGRWHDIKTPPMEERLAYSP